MKRYLGTKKRLKIYIDTTDKYQDKPLWQALLLKVKECKIAGATITKAVAGVGAFSELHSSNLISLSQKLPLVIEIIDTKENIENFINTIDDMIDEGLITLDDVEVINYKKRGV